MTEALPLLLAVAAIAAAAITHGAGRYFARKGWLADRPGARSSHQTPTPRTGGAAIMLGFSIAALAFSIVTPGLAKLTGVIACAFALGVLDDARPLPAMIKLAGQIAVAMLFVVLFGAVESVPAPVLGELALGFAAPVFTVFWIVAFMNAFNFMDGANGIAATAAVFALCALGVAAAGTGAATVAAASILLAGAVFGFLPLNFPAARLFMGDGGSQSVGFAIAALAALAASAAPDVATTSALFVPIVFMPFLFDVAFTLAHRVARRRAIAEAHNEHLYQLLMRLGASHVSVTALYLTLIAISTIAAIFANALPVGLAFMVPALLFAFFIIPALTIFRRASAAGLLARPSATLKETPPMPMAKAAE
ncbi:MAG: glycosyltransferase family 4 protein [Parvularculaceae bacterium]